MNKKQLRAYLLIFLGINQLVAGQPTGVQSTVPQTSVAQAAADKPTRFEALRKKIAQGISARIGALKDHFKKTTFLEHACFIGSVCGIIALKLLVNSKRNSHLMSAIRNGHGDLQKKEIVRLLKAGADPNYLDKRGRSPVHEAILSNRQDILVLLLDAGADPNVQTHDHINYSGLHLAAHSGLTDIATLLLDKKDDAQINARTSLGDTPLHEAVHYHHSEVNDNFEVAELLLDKGAKVDTLDQWGRIPVQSATWVRSNPDMLDMLQDKQFNDELSAIHDRDLEALIRDSNQRRLNFALWHAAGQIHPRAARQRHSEEIESLLAQGAQIDAQDSSDGSTPLHRATREGQVKVAKLLLDHEAPVGATSDYGNTPLHIAAFWGYKDMAALLLDRCALVTARDNRGFTPLHETATAPNSYRLETADQLLRKGASPEAPDLHGRTPTHRAAARGADALDVFEGTQFDDELTPPGNQRDANGRLIN